MRSYFWFSTNGMVRLEMILSLLWGAGGRDVSEWSCPLKKLSVWEGKVRKHTFNLCSWGWGKKKGWFPRDWKVSGFWGGWKMLSAISVNEGCCSHQASSHRQMPGLSTLRGPRMAESRMLAPDSWGANQRDDFNEPSLLDPPILRKALNSLTWCLAFFFFLIKSSLLMFWLLGFCCKTSIYPGFFLTSLEQPLRAIWGCLLGLSPQKILQIKHDPQLLGCAFLLVHSSDDYEGTQRDFSTSPELDEDL